MITPSAVSGSKTSFYQIEMTAKNKKVLAVALASLALFTIQIGLSLSLSLAITFSVTLLTYLSEKYLRTEDNDWFDTKFDKKWVTIWTIILLVRPLIPVITCWYFRLPLPKPPQEGIAKLLLTYPWQMFPIAAILAPVAEEILFRGFILERLEDLASMMNRKVDLLSSKAVKMICNMAQATIFGVVHLRSKIEDGFKIPVAMALSLSGFFMGKSKENNKSLLAPMTFHSANNIASCAYILVAQRI